MHSSQYPAAPVYPQLVEIHAETTATPAARKFGANHAIGIFCAYIGAQFAAAIIIGSVVGFAHGVSRSDHAKLPQIGSGSTLAIAMFGALLGSAIACDMARRSLGGGFARAVGLRRASPRHLWLATAVGLGICVCFTALLASHAFAPPSRNQLNPLAMAATKGGWSLHVWTVFVSVIAPLTEELVFRGVCFTGLARSWSPRRAACITTAVFVLMHVTSVPPYWPALGAVCALGAAAQAVRMRSGSLLPGMIMHSAYNSGLALVTYVATWST